ncbi:MAG: response regulator [Burkholderiales bacterium]|nr:response regulator [Burkholderiales bacterium]
MAAGPAHRAVVLLVEDDPDEAALALRAFARSGFGARVEVAHDGESALERLHGLDAAARPVPALVLLDLKLPRLDGIEVLKRIRSNPRTRLVPVVMLSTSVEPRDVAAALGLNANAYVRKPTAFDDFVDALRRVAEFWLVLNERPPEA